MDSAHAIVEFSSRSTHTEASEVGNLPEFLRKDACNDRLADSNPDGTSNGSENIDSFATGQTHDVITSLPDEHETARGGSHVLEGHRRLKGDKRYLEQASRSQGCDQRQNLLPGAINRMSMATGIGNGKYIQA